MEGAVQFQNIKKQHSSVHKITILWSISLAFTSYALKSLTEKGTSQIDSYLAICYGHLLFLCKLVVFNRRLVKKWQYFMVCFWMVLFSCGQNLGG